MRKSLNSTGGNPGRIFLTQFRPTRCPKRPSGSADFPLSLQASPAPATDRVLCVGLRPVPLPSLVFHFGGADGQHCRPYSSALRPNVAGSWSNFLNVVFDHSRLRIHVPRPLTRTRDPQSPLQAACFASQEKHRTAAVRFKNIAEVLRDRRLTAPATADDAVMETSVS